MHVMLVDVIICKMLTFHYLAGKACMCCYSTDGDPFLKKKMPHMASTSSLNFPTPVDVKLNGSNYKEWYTTMHIILLGLELLSHVDGTSFLPKETDPLSTSTS